MGQIAGYYTAVEAIGPIGSDRWTAHAYCTFLQYARGVASGGSLLGEGLVRAIQTWGDGEALSTLVGDAHYYADTADEPGFRSTAELWWEQWERPRDGGLVRVPARWGDLRVDRPAHGPEGSTIREDAIGYRTCRDTEMIWASGQVWIRGARESVIRRLSAMLCADRWVPTCPEEAQWLDDETWARLWLPRILAGKV